MSNIESFKEYMSMAIDPETPPEQLNTLIFEECEVNRLREADISCAERLILSALATNPNTSISGLVALANLVPEQVALNPALSFLLIENPLLFQEFSIKMLSGFLQVKEFAAKFGKIILAQYLGSDSLEEIKYRKKERFLNTFWSNDHLVVIWNDFIKDKTNNIGLDSYEFRQQTYDKVAFKNISVNSFNSIQFINCTFNTCTFVDIEVDIPRALRFLGCDLHGCQFKSVKSRFTFFRQCDLVFCKFNNCSLPNSSFDRCELGGASFYDCDLTGANFDKCKAEWEPIYTEATNLANVKVKDSSQIFRDFKNEQFK